MRASVGNMGDSDERRARLQGNYKIIGHKAQFLRVDGNIATLKDTHETFVLTTIISYGEFGETHLKIREKQENQCKYNVKFTIPDNLNKEATERLYQLPIEYGVISDDGTNCYVEGQKIYQFVKISNEEYDAMINDFDPIEAPPGPYTVEERQGRILWLCGPPGTGKSTAAQIMARNHGYVYYEADTFNHLRNPFIDLNVSNPSLSQYGQKILKGPGAKERVFLIKRFQEQIGPMVAGLDFDKEVLKEYYTALSEDIKKQKTRIGGDWVIANVAFSRDIRDAIRAVLGKDVHFVGMTLDESECMNRVKSRHDDQPEILEKIRTFVKMFDIGEDTDEPNLAVLNIDHLSPDEVVNKIFQMNE